MSHWFADVPGEASEIVPHTDEPRSEVLEGDHGRMVVHGVGQLVALGIFEQEKGRVHADADRPALEQLVESRTDSVLALAEGEGSLAFGIVEPSTHRRGEPGHPAQRYFEGALAIAKQLVEREPGRADLLRDLSVSFERLARVDPTSAVEWLERALEIRRSQARLQPDHATVQRELAITRYQWAIALGERNEHERSMDALRESYERLRELHRRGALEARFQALHDHLARRLLNDPDRGLRPPAARATMWAVFVSRGRGLWVPILLILSGVLPMIPAQEIGVATAQSIALVCELLSGAWVAWYGRKTLLEAQAILGRPLAWYEWVFDPVLTEPRPFHSFMLVQMPWWSAAFLALAITLGVLAAS